MVKHSGIYKSASRSKGVPAKSITQRHRKVYQPVKPAIPINSWEVGMDYEETIVPKKYVRPATPLPEGYIAPEISGALVIHGSSLNTYFHLPPHIEVVIFSRRGQILHTYVIKELLKWIDKDFHTISRSSLQEYHLKRFVEKKCSGESILERENYYKVIQQQHPNVCKSRRFKYESRCCSVLWNITSWLY